MRFNLSRVQKVMPKDSLFVSILREPGEVFESSFHYFYEIVPSFNKLPQNELNSTEIWLNNASKYFDSEKRTGFWFIAKNHMMYDFGFDPMMENDNRTRAAIEAIDKTFDFIMISNYMDESLVLLADILCWPLADVSSVVLKPERFTKAKQIKDQKDSRKSQGLE